MDTEYCDNCGLLHDPGDGDCEGCKMSSEIKSLEKAIHLLMEFTEDCAVSHHETRYKYRARVIIRKLQLPKP